ncbi:hypothetical protein AK51_10420 [Serratia nematodiphila DZ0503SBS1]|nr:hypothetical protein AK51_10420 [Serratia nematodiphila DZ0503SBS1]
MGLRAQVGNEVGDGDVGFMADGADDRNAAGEDRPRHAFVVEAPQIFQRTAAAADDQHVAFVASVGGLDARTICIGASAPCTEVG